MNKDELILELEKIENENKELINQLVDERNVITQKINDNIKQCNDIQKKVNEIQLQKRDKMINLLSTFKKENADTIYTEDKMFRDLNDCIQARGLSSYSEVKLANVDKVVLRYGPSYSDEDCLPSEKIKNSWIEFDDAESKKLYFAINDTKELFYLPHDEDIFMLTKFYCDYIILSTIKYDKVTNTIFFNGKPNYGYSGWHDITKLESNDYKLFRTYDSAIKYVEQNFIKGRAYEVQDVHIYYDVDELRKCFTYTDKSGKKRHIIARRKFPDSDLEIKREGN